MKRSILSLLLASAIISANAQGIENNAEKTTAKNHVTDIIVVFKMHFDIGYTQWAEGVLQQYSGPMLTKTLQSIDETASLPEAEQFVWTVPAWPLKYMLENSAPELKQRLEKAIKEERIIPHALPITFETESSDLENLVRGLTYASEINRRFGLPVPRDAKLTDVPSHSWVIPTLLKNAGIDILHIGCNPGSPSPDVPTLFWWQGPDGSRLLTFNWAEYYGSGILPPKDWKYKTWLAMIHTHENTGAPSPKEVADLLASAKKEMPDARIRIGRLSDFYDLLMDEKPDLPVVIGDMPDTWIHGYMSLPGETKMSKKLQRETFNTENLNTQINNWMGISDPIDKYIDKAVENMILFDEHTFGVAMTHGDQQGWSYDDDFKINKSLDYYSYAEGSWKEKANRIQSADRIVVPIMHRELKQLAASVSVKGKRIVVYNSLPWTRNGRVKFFAGVYQKNFQVYGIKDPETNEVIPVYNDDNLISFDVTGIPAMGYKTYIPILEPLKGNLPGILPADEKNHQIENSYFRLIINPVTGALSSAFDKKNKKELIDLSSEDGFGQYIYEQFGQEKLDSYNKAYIKPGSESWALQEMGRPYVPDKETTVYKGRCEKIIYRNMGNAVSATVFGKTDDPGSEKYLITYTLYENQPYIEVNWGIDGKKPDSKPEAGWLAFPFDLQKPEYRLYRTGGIVDPQKDLIRRSNQDFYFLNTSMTMFDSKGNGIVLNCPTSPGISIDNRGLYTFSGKKELKGANVFTNLFNNQWGTNFTEWTEGSFSSKFYIWSYSGYNSESSFITPSEETRTPLYGVFYDGEKGDFPLSQKGLTLSRKGILITAYCKNRDGEGTTLRLWEQAGNEGLCRITLPEGNRFINAIPANLRGEINEKQAIEIKDNQFEVMMKANHPATFILK
jgi:alpha-mannosidase